MAAIDNMVRRWFEWEVVDDLPRLVLVVETNLETTPGAPGHNTGQLQELVDAITDGYRQSAVQFHKFRIIPLGVAAPSPLPKA